MLDRLLKFLYQQLKFLHPVDTQILIREQCLPNDVGDIASKDAQIILKLFHRSLLTNFTSEHVLLAMGEKQMGEKLTK